MKHEENEFPEEIVDLHSRSKAKVIPQELVDQILDGRCILFLGSGASSEARAPTSDQLSAQLADKYLHGRHRNETLARVASYIEHKPGAGRRPVVEYVVDQLSSPSPTKAHEALTQYPWVAIFTTNYDLLIEKAYDKSCSSKQIRPILSSSDLSMQAQAPGSNPVFLYKLHGSISHPYSAEIPLVISEDDYDTAVSNRVALLRLLESYKYKDTFLFVGYSFGDPDLSHIWRTVRVELGRLSQWAYAIWPNHSDEQKELWKSRYVLLLNFTFSEFFDALPSPITVKANQFSPGAPPMSTRSAVIRLLTSLLKRRDPSRYAMSEWVAEHALAVGREVGLSKKEMPDLKDSALVSDIGLLGISDSILYKPGPLTANEWQELRKNPGIGEGVLSLFPELKAVAKIVGSVHEHFDGSGYPRGLQSDKIPIAARIIAVIQMFYSLTHSRPYRPAYSLEEAAHKIHEMAGTGFDPNIVTTFELTMMEKT